MFYNCRNVLRGSLFVLVLVYVALSAMCSSGPDSKLLKLTMPGQTVHNSHYLAASFLYELQTLLGASATFPSLATASSAVDACPDASRVRCSRSV